jgi:hypothetical protein
MSAVVVCVVFVAPVWANDPEFTLRPASAYAFDDVNVAVIGGQQADPSDWPATLIFSNRCTSTLVGERVVLTAAHCVPDGATGVVDLSTDRFAITCHHHPDYVEDTPDDDPRRWEKVSPDFALCLMAESLPGVEAEWVNLDTAVPAIDTRVVLLGFGCNAEGGVDGGFGTLFEGIATVQGLPSGDRYYTKTRGGAAVCFGDSGGAAYLPSRPRKVFAVNSRGDISKVSYLSTTSVPGFFSWAATWANSHGVRICGIHPDAAGCRLP